MADQSNLGPLWIPAKCLPVNATPKITQFVQKSFIQILQVSEWGFYQSYKGFGLYSFKPWFLSLYKVSSSYDSNAYYIILYL